MQCAFSKQGAGCFLHWSHKLLFGSSTLLHSGKLKLISEEQPEIAVKFVVLDEWRQQPDTHLSFQTHRSHCSENDNDTTDNILVLLLILLQGRRDLSCYTVGNILTYPDRVATWFPSGQQQHQSANIWSSSVIIYALWSVVSFSLFHLHITLNLKHNKYVFFVICAVITVRQSLATKF